jgi:hypothetical protein
MGSCARDLYRQGFRGLGAVDCFDFVAARRSVITDTQILSYYFNGSAAIPKESLRISSITAAEFLLIQTENPTKANYYPILPVLARHRPQSIGVRFRFDSKRHAAAGKHRTDQIILTFGPSESYVEYGSLAITQLINERHGELFALCISHLAKPRRSSSERNSGSCWI